MALKPTLTIPTGYESLQRQAATKRKLAEAMLQQGLNPDPNQRSWAQVLGSLAQAWAGKRLGKQADEAEALVGDQIRQAYEAKRGDFYKDAGVLQPQQLVEKYGKDPLLQDDVKPYSDAMATALKERENLISFGGQRVRQGDVIGQYDNDPNKMVHVGPNGQMGLNPVAVTAAGISNGTLVPQDGYQTTGQMPGAQRLVSAMSGQPQAAQPLTSEQGGAILGNAAKTNTISGVDALRVRQSMGPGGQAAFSKWVQDHGIRVQVNTPQEARQLPSGTIILLPDGTEGRVP